jgi:hypothetical protein
MKTRTKLVVTAAALLTVTGAAIGTSTYAWFTANKEASVKVDQLTAISKEGNLEVTANAGEGYTYDSANNIVSFTNKNITEISGNGTSFFKLVNFSADYMTADSIAEPAATGYWAQFSLSIKNTSTTGDPISIYLGTKDAAHKTDISPIDSGVTEDSGAAKSARVAISGDTTKVFGQAADVTNNASTAFLKSIGTTIDLVDQRVPDSDTTNTALFSSLTDAWHGAFGYYNSVALATAAGETALVNGIAAGASSTVTVKIWVEGQDTDCVNSTASLGNFFVDLFFYAL